MRISLVLVAAGVLLAAVPASAAEKGFFAGVGAGQMATEVDNVWGSSYDFDENSTAFKIFGGYKFFPWLGVEGAYIYGGEPSVKDSGQIDGLDVSQELSIRVNALVAAAIFSLPIGDKFELYAKPGWAYWGTSTDYRASVSDGVSQQVFKNSENDHGSAFFIGGGAAFNFTENLGVRVEYEWFDAVLAWDNYQDEFTDDVDANAGLFSASFVYSF